MELVKNTTFKKSLLKATSGILSFILTANIGLNLMVEKVSAREIEYESNRKTITLTSSRTSGTEYFYLMKDDDSYFITDSLDNPLHEKDIYADCNFNINHNCTLVVKTDYQIEYLKLYGGEESGSEAVIIIDEGVKLNCRSITGTGLNKILNYGEFFGEGFCASVMENDGIKEFLNAGTITGRGVSPDSDIYSDTPGSKLIPHDSFSIDNRTINAVVIAGPNVDMRSDGGTFTLQVNDAEKVISGEIFNRKAANDLLDVSSASLSDVPNTFTGQNLNEIFMDYVSVSEAYDKSNVYFMYRDSAGNDLDGMPTLKGSYSVQAIAPYNGTFKSSFSEWKSFNIQDFTLADLYPSGAPYFTISGVKNGYYVASALVLTPPEGILIGCPTSPDSEKSTYSTSVSLTYLDLCTDGDIENGINDDVEISFKDNRGTETDGAIISDSHTLGYYISDIDNYVFDNYNPIFDAKIIEADAGFKETSIDDKETIIVAEELQVIVSDENLDSVILSVNGTETNLRNSIDEDGTCVISLFGTVGTKKTIIITATDLAGRISKAEFTLYHPERVEPTLNVTLPDSIYVGDEYEPTIKNDSDGKMVISYIYTDGSDRVTTTPPKEAGTYQLHIEVAATYLYEAKTYDKTYIIQKYTPSTSTVTVPNIYVGETIVPELITDSDGKSAATFEYKLKSDPVSAYSEEKPTDAGTYTVRATIPATDRYGEIICESTFTISKKNATASVSVSDIYVGGTVSPTITTESDGKDDAVFEYKLTTAPESEFSSTVPTAAGSYYVRATIPATAEYLGVSCTSEFTISRNKVSVMELTVNDIYYGQTVSPIFKTDSDGSVTIMFKPSTATDSAYSTIVPTTAGKYVARAIVSETDVYESAVCSAEFSISYLEAPKNAFNPTGKSGNNGYFTSDVVLTAPEGYTISSTPNGKYSKSIPYTEGMDTIYLKRDDGAITSAITIADKPRIDKVAPAITTSSGPIDTGSVIYISSMNVTVSDPNLKSLKVNGEPVDLTTNSSNVLTLSPGYGTKTFVITAEDMAGNITTVEYTLKADWLKDKVIIPDVVLPLEGNESYNLGEGYWLVTRNTPEGPVTDDTVYSGNMPFYVNEGGDYTFTKITQ